MGENLRRFLEGEAREAALGVCKSSGSFNQKPLIDCEELLCLEMGQDMRSLKREK